jgi:hypothetical protein
MSEIDLGAASLRGLADRVEASLDASQPTAWAPAFAAADGKVSKEEPAPEPITDAGGDAGTETAAISEAGQAVARAGGFAALVKGWLGRA